MSEMRKVYLSTVPSCDLCGKQEQEAFDSPVKGHGSWGYMCKACFAKHGRPDVASHILPSSMKPPPSPRKQPSLEQIEDWLQDGTCEATDGCEVEPDGTCEHGKKSWALVMGLI